MDTPTKLTMEQMSKDLNRIAGDLSTHTQLDEGRFDRIELLLQKIDGKMDTMQTKLNLLEAKIDPLIEIYDGLRFGSKSLMWTAAVVAAVTVIGAPTLWAYHHFYKP